MWGVRNTEQQRLFFFHCIVTRNVRAYDNTKRNNVPWGKAAVTFTDKNGRNLINVAIEATFIEPADNLIPM